DPRYVVALTLAALTAFGGPTHYVEAWMTAAGYEDDRIFRLYVALFIVDFMSEHGQAFNDNPVPSSVDDRNRLLGVFAECLRLAERWSSVKNSQVVDLESGNGRLRRSILPGIG